MFKIFVAKLAVADSLSEFITKVVESLISSPSKVKSWLSEFCSCRMSVSEAESVTSVTSIFEVTAGSIRTDSTFVKIALEPWNGLTSIVLANCESMAF